jgi:hypothetical protein
MVLPSVGQHTAGTGTRSLLPEKRTLTSYEPWAYKPRFLGFSSICDARNATSVARMCAERTHYQRLKRTVVHRPDFISYARWSKSRAIAAWRVLKNELQPQLHNPARRGTIDHAKGRLIQSAPRNAEVGMVEHIEKFAAQL